MRIGLDLATCTPADGGIGRYAEELGQALLAQAIRDGRDPDDFVLFMGERCPAWLRQRVEGAESAAALPRIRMERYAGHRHALFQANVVLGPRLSQSGVEVFHSPDMFRFPLTSARRLALVVTIHDVIPLAFPQAVTRKHRWIWRGLLPLVVRRAARVVVDSQATARDLVERFPEARDKVRVVYLGVDARFAPSPPAQVASLRSRLGLPSEYLLSVGTLSPRKNLARVFEAYAVLLREQGDVPPLVVAGQPGWLWQPVMERVRQLRLEAHVTFCGFIPDQDLPALLTGASVFLLPSLYEGFGLPILEAMACGTPVLTSNCSSLPEVAGDAALLVDPADPAAIADGVRRLLANETDRGRLIRRGFEQARAFRWESTARKTLAVYREALESHQSQ